MNGKCLHIYPRGVMCKQPCNATLQYCGMHMKRPIKSVKNEETLLINRQTVSMILDLDSVERKDLCWNRYSLKSAKRFSSKNVIFADDVLKIGIGGFLATKLSSLKNFRSIIQKNYCPYIEEILSSFPGKIILAGGSVSKALWGIKNKFGNISDADFFMINVENPNELIREICELIIKLCEADKVAYLLSRNQNVTSIIIRDDIHINSSVDELTEKEWSDLIRYPGRKIQIIHRIYPTPMHVLGGFDIPSAYYDGTNVYTNSTGLFFIAHKLIFLDPSRRSTSYKARLKKYINQGFDLIISNIGRKTVKNELDFSIFVSDPQGQPLNPCKDLSIKIFNVDNEIISVFPEGYHNNNGDYESGGECFHWKTQNAFLALSEKIDHITWFGTTIESVFDNPKIDWMLSKQLLVPKYHRIHKDTIEISANLAIKWFQENHKSSIHIKSRQYSKAEFNDELTKLKTKIENGIRNANLNCSGGQVRYIRDNPGGQYWTSAINPIVEDVRNYYHPKMCNILTIGIPDEIFAIIYLGWRQKEGIFKNLLFVGDAFKLLMTEIRRVRAHFLFQQIIL